MFEKLRLGEAKELFAKTVPLPAHPKPSQRGEKRPSKKIKWYSFSS